MNALSLLCLPRDQTLEEGLESSDVVSSLAQVFLQSFDLRFGWVLGAFRVFPVLFQCLIQFALDFLQLFMLDPDESDDGVLVLAPLRVGDWLVVKNS